MNFKFIRKLLNWFWYRQVLVVAVEQGVIERPDTANATLLEKVRFRERLTEILLMIASASTMMLTYYGVTVTMGETGATVVQKGQALAFSLTIGVFAWLGWFYLFGLIYRLRGKRLAAALTAGIIFVGSLAAIDAPFNMMAIAGGAATQMSLVDTADAFGRKKEAAFTRATVVRRMVPAMRTQAVRFRQLEADEIAHGTYSGSRAAGKVSSGFGQIATLLETLIADVESGLSASERLQADIGVQFAAMKAETYRQGPIRARVEAVSVAADRIDDILARLSQFDYAVSITATLASLEAIFPAPTVAGSAFEQRQNAELGVIAEMAKPVATALRGALAELEAVPLPVAERVRPQGPHEAIRTYWKPLLPEWCAAVFIDLAPSLLLIILIAAWREQERQGRGETRRPESAGIFLNDNNGASS